MYEQSALVSEDVKEDKLTKETENRLIICTNRRNMSKISDARPLENDSNVFDELPFQNVSQNLGPDNFITSDYEVFDELSMEVEDNSGNIVKGLSKKIDSGIQFDRFEKAVEVPIDAYNQDQQMENIEEYTGEVCLSVEPSDKLAVEQVSNKEGVIEENEVSDIDTVDDEDNMKKEVVLGVVFGVVYDKKIQEEAIVKKHNSGIDDDVNLEGTLVGEISDNGHANSDKISAEAKAYYSYIDQFDPGGDNQSISEASLFPRMGTILFKECEVNRLSAEIKKLKEECHTNKELSESTKKDISDLLLVSVKNKTLVERKTLELDAKTDELSEGTQPCENIKSSCEEKELRPKNLNFVNEKLITEFEEKIKLLGEKNKGLSSDFFVANRLAISSLLPVLVSGVLSYSNKHEQANVYLKNIVVQRIVQEDQPTSNHVGIFSFVCDGEHRNMMFNVLREVFVSYDDALQITTTKILIVVVPYIDAKVVPALITLDPDQNLRIKYASNDFFGLWEQNLKIRGKIRFHIDAFLKDGSHEARINVIRALVVVIKAAPKTENIKTEEDYTHYDQEGKLSSNIRELTNKIALFKPAEMEVIVLTREQIFKLEKEMFLKVIRVTDQCIEDLCRWVISLVHCCFQFLESQIIRSNFLLGLWKFDLHSWIDARTFDVDGLLPCSRVSTYTLRIRCVLSGGDCNESNMSTKHRKGEG